MANLVLGPILRFVGATQATIWVETDAPAEVEILGHTARTFQVAGHHYALVAVEGLGPGSTHEYGVRLDGEPAWPLADEAFRAFGPSAVHTLGPPGGRLRIAFGSCRLARPHEPPWSLPRSTHRHGGGVDALRTLALELAAAPERRPDLLLLLGDQVYADAVSPGTSRFIHRRRGLSRPPGGQVADFEEYVHLYRESWSDPAIRWLLSTVPTAMIFDDHDLHDDWNTSASWVAAMRAKPWWDERVTGGLSAYWVYQHLGNLSPGELAADELLCQVREAGDGMAPLRQRMRRADREVGGWSWSFSRDLGRTRLVVIDSRCGRVLDGGRSMLAGDEWAWAERQLGGDVDHLLLATTLPFALPAGAHHLEVWNEAVCAGAWGGLAARAGERLRRGIDLEHWAAFHDSFNRLGDLLGQVAAGRRGSPPAATVLLSGDVHYAYLARLGFPREPAATAPVYQVVCSPLRNELAGWLRAANRLAFSRPAASLFRRLGRLAGAAPDAVTWRVLDGPHFDNQIGILELEDRAARLQVQRPARGGNGQPTRLEPIMERDLTG